MSRMRPELDMVLWRGGVGEATVRLSTPEAVARMRERIGGFALFRPDEYLALSPDLIGLDAYTHYSEYGVWEPHRRFVSEKTIASVLGAMAEGALPAPAAPDASRLAKALARLRGRPIHVLVNSSSRWFIHDLGDQLAGGLRSLGLQAELSNEGGAPGDGLLLFVAPHEFFTQAGGASWASLETLSRAVMYVTEPAETPQFRAAVPYLLSCAGVVSPYAQVAALAQGAGVPALTHVPPAPEGGPEPLPDHPIARALPRQAKAYDPGLDVWRDRPLDVAFFGTETAVRDAWFAANAGRLSDLSCVLQLTRWYGPAQAQQPEDARAGLVRFIGRRTKIVLNLPEEELTSVDWRRMMLGAMAQRALAVSTFCLPHPVFKPGVHYLEDSFRRLPKLIDWLLRAEDGRETADRVRQQGYSAFREQGSQIASAAALASFIAEHGV